MQDHGDAIGVWNLGGLATLDDFSAIGSPDHAHMGGVALPPGGLPVNTSRFCYSLEFVCFKPLGTIVNGFSVKPHVSLPTWSWTHCDNQGCYPPDFCGAPTGSETAPTGVRYMLNAPPSLAGDLNCDGLVDIDDIVYFINYVFVGGPPPKDPNNDGVPDC